MNILVFGAGYVGLSNAVMLASKNEVTVVDIDEDKISDLKAEKSPIKDSLLTKHIKNNELKLSFKSKLNENLKKIQVVIIATPTDFNDDKKSFDTKSIEKVLRELKKRNYKNLVAIRSTIPIGFTEKINKKYNFDIAYFPEFLREGSALKDNLYPSRIICGSKSPTAKKFLRILENSALKKNVSSLIVSPSEAESIKLFSNTYLAMRIAFFNEVDSLALSKNLDSKNIIDGISLDPRVGNYYNNPSFGYGGYCLPKDTKQLRKNFDNIPQKIIQATIQSNKARKNFIIKEISKKKESKIGIYRLSMKSGSDNFRESAVLDIINVLKNKKDLMIFEPMLKEKKFMGIKVENNINTFFKWSEIIVANRLNKEIEKKNKVIFTRDIYKEN
tara:strand:+ start:107 stop:1267 length:1161 start_codon:yes stop_codon:yes gene_type:complete